MPLRLLLQAVVHSKMAHPLGEVAGDVDKVLLGMEFQLVAGGLVGQDQRQRSLALVGLEQRGQAGAEVGRQQRRVKFQHNTGNECFRDIAKQEYLLDFECIRSRLALGALFRL